MFGKYTVLTTIFSAIILTGCGGGGGGSSAVSQTSYLTLFEPAPVSSSQIQTVGSASTNTGNIASKNFGQASLTLSALNIGSSGTSPAASLTYQLLSNKHITDTGAESAWSQGWTGLGTSVSIIDDFSAVSSTASTTITVPRYYENSYWGSTRDYMVEYTTELSFTHGSLVSNIAGGDGSGSVSSATLDYEVSSVTDQGCSVMGSSFGTPYCGQLSTSRYVSPSIYNFEEDDNVTSFIKSAGIAKEATMINNHVDLSSSQNVTNTLNGIMSHYENSNGSAAINMSLGLSINTVGLSLSDLKSELSNTDRISSTDAVITIAAGNGGAACTETNLNGCNALAMAFALDPNTNSNTIIVGATTDSGSNETIATYSSRAGVFKDRFMVAHGDVGLVSRSGNQISGTSFSAPRVAGAAAILRQKFSNLSGSDAASILLLTANKDINSDGINDFTGISSTYGHGKLNLSSALSPIGTLAIN